MTYSQSFLMGLVQGLGEFLPISSSGHLVVVPWLFNFSDPGLTFDVALHFGTLIAIVFYFWKDWVDLISGTLRFRLKKFPVENKGALQIQDRIFWTLVVASIPGALMGLLLEHWAETFFRHPLLVAFDMSLMGIVLLVVDTIKKKKDRTIRDVNFKDALLIGFSQGLALVPGVSRSGITITTGLGRGFSRPEAARYSFLLATPITFGACLLKAKHFFQSPVDGPIFFAILTSAVFGFLSIKYLIRFVQKYSFRIFVYYRFLFTIVVCVAYFLKNR